MSSSTTPIPSTVQLWSETERPQCIAECITLSAATRQSLQSFANRSQLKDFPHLLVYGVEGSGKHTIVDALISELSTDDDCNEQGCKRERRLWQIPTNHPSKTLDIHTVQSAIHVHLNPSESGINCDRAVIQYIVMKIMEQQTNSSGIRLLILDDVDHLSLHAQNALRRTMETCMSACRLILICRSLSLITSALRSRCCLIRVPAPTTEQLVQIMTQILHHKSITLSQNIIQDLAKQSHRNLHQALLLLQQHTDSALYPTTLLTPGSSNDTVPEAVKSMHSSLTQQISGIAELIATSPTRETMELVRLQVQQLLNQCMDPTKLLTLLMHELMKHCVTDSGHVIVSAAAEFQYRLVNGTKPIVHIEAFLIQCASVFVTNQIS